MSQDPYCYPGTGVLRNKFEIRDEEMLKATEARVAAVALFVLEDEPLRGPMDEERLKQTHSAIFQELYEWAGIYRENVGTMTRGRVGGYVVTYGSSEFVPAEMKRIFGELETEGFLRGLSQEQLASRLAYYYSEMDAAHPFREGNSRTLRKFSSDLALAAGWELDWGPCGWTENAILALYTARDLAVIERRYGPLAAIIQKNLHVP